MDMKIQMELPPIFYRLENKVVPARELARYLDAKSPSELLLALRRLERESYLKFDVMLSGEYYKQGNAHTKLLLREDVLTHPDPFGVLQRDTYGLGVKSDAVLSEKEILEVMGKLPVDATERYLQLRLHSMDKEKLRELIKPAGADKDEYADRVEYKGLVADGAKITYYEEPIEMGFQQRQVLRLLLENQGEPCSKGDFTKNVDIFTGDSYSSVDASLRNLIYEVRKKLKAVIGKNCIKNKPSEGWYLELEP